MILILYHMLLARAYVDLSLLKVFVRMKFFLHAHEPSIRLSVFAGVFIVMALWEFLAPRRNQLDSRQVRWPSNLAVVLVDTLLLRIALPTTAVGLAFAVQGIGWGFFNIVAVPDWLGIFASVVVLDLAIYLQHVAFHAVPMFWRLHRMHHADLAFDVTTGVRFHPFEILLSMLIKFAVIALLGAPPVAVLIFEVLLNATSMFNHGNVRIPAWIDHILRWIIVTPDMHRVHHSMLKHETDSNFGFNLSCWDRLFRTYRPQPEAGHAGMTIGIEQFRDPRELRLDRMLSQPFRQDRPTP